MTRATLALLALLLPSTASAEVQRFLVTGKDVAGRAEVRERRARPDGSTEVEVVLTFRAFGRADGAERVLRGPGLLTSSRLTWRFQTHVSVPRSGVVDWLRDPYLTTPDPRSYDVETEVTLRRARGELRGLVAGTEQVWSPQPAALSDDLVVLMIPGLSTNYWNRLGLPYFDENRDTLRALGLEVRRLGAGADDVVDPHGPFRTEGSVAQNAELIATAVRAEAARGRRVVLFAHSKGGTDATAAVVLHPDIAPHVAGLVAIQPVYGGSPVADLAASSWISTMGVRLAFELWAGGSRDAVLDLTQAHRREFVSAHPFPADRIPTVVVRSTFDRSKLEIGPTARGGSLSHPGLRLFQRVLRANQGLIAAAHGAGSDGMVTLQGQTIPGATFIDKDDLDHFEPGLEMISRHTPAGLTTEAMLTLLAKLPAR